MCKDLLGKISVQKVINLYINRTAVLKIFIISHLLRNSFVMITYLWSINDNEPISSLGDKSCKRKKKEKLWKR